MLPYDLFPPPDAIALDPAETAPLLYWIAFGVALAGVVILALEAFVH